MKIVLIIISSLRRDHVGVFGNAWLGTESLDAVAKRGKVFARVRCTAADPTATRIEILTGLNRGRFVPGPAPFRLFCPEMILPARFRATGYHTVLLTDNFPQLALYEHFQSAFDTVVSIPGQGADPHALDVLPSLTSLRTVVSGGQGPGPGELNRYARNHSRYSDGGHPSDRLFRTLNAQLDAIGEENAFVLVDSYGLQPPWDAPAEFRRFRGSVDTKLLAWPVAGPVTATEPGIEKALNFLRRAYADSCLFIDSRIGSIPADGIHLVVLSDQGTLIGDEDYLLSRPDQTFNTLIDQVLVTRAPGMKGGTRTDEPVVPVDIHASLLAMLGRDLSPGGDGRNCSFFESPSPKA